MSKEDYYKVLGVSIDASDQDIKQAYRKKAMQYHPDRSKGDKLSEKKFKEVNEAYEVLKDKDKRNAYDNYGHNAFDGSGNAAGGFGQTGGFEDIFGDIFSDFMGDSSQRQSKTYVKRGSDLRKDITITLEEAFYGLKKKFDFMSPQSCKSCEGTGSKSGKLSQCNTCNGSGSMRMQQGFFVIEKTCNTCSGTGESVSDPCKSCNGKGRKVEKKVLSIDIPAGVEDGIRMRIPGAGECGYRGGESGDLYVFITVKRHNFFKRHNNDLHVEIPIPVTKAILGGNIEVPLINGNTSIINIPEGTQTGSNLKLKGKGMPVMKSGGRHGNMILNINVEIPIKISSKQKELLKQFEESIGHKNIPQSNSFLDNVKKFFG